jgi:signal transduction histidine kinase
MTNDTSLPERIGKNSAARYALSVVAIALALVVGRLLGSLLGGAMPYVAVFPAIAFSTWYCGLGPSITSSAIALAVLKYSLITPGHVVAISTASQAFDLAVFGATVAVVVGLGERRRRECEVLRRAQGELEQQVRERTIELDVANQGLRELTSRLMQSQDDERRRIARELHDSVGQNLAAMTMNLTTMLTEIERLTQIRKAASDSLELAQNMTKEVRTVSYLLHPPLLDEAGLASALRWYVQGFSERGTIQVALEVPEDFGRLPQELETAVFRTVQECLTNIHRHSGSPVARIRLARSGNEIQLQVEDEGNGIADEKLDEIRSAGAPGVGIRGMRERLRQLGGGLEIQSNGHGTTIVARLSVGTSGPAAAA